MSGMIRVWARAAAIQLEEIAAANAIAAAAASAASTTQPGPRNVDAQSVSGDAGVATADHSTRSASNSIHASQDLRALHAKIEQAAAARHAELESDRSAQPEKEVVMGGQVSKTRRPRSSDSASPGVSSTTNLAPPPTTESTMVAWSDPRSVTSEAPAESSRAAQERAASRTAFVDLPPIDKKADDTAEKASRPEEQLSKLSTSTADDAKAAKAAPLLSAAAPDPLPPQATTDTPPSTANGALPENQAVAEQEEEVRMEMRKMLIPSRKSCCVRRKSLRLE